MSDVVLKPINTAHRRLKAGDLVNEGDDVSPHTHGSLRTGGFIGPAAVGTGDSKARFAAAAAMKSDDE